MSDADALWPAGRTGGVDYVGQVIDGRGAGRSRVLGDSGLI